MRCLGSIVLILGLGLRLDSVEQWLIAGGYLALFGLLFACGLGLPLPEDIPLTVAGFLIAKHEMTLPVAAVAAWCGIIGGDCVLYHLGKKFGHGVTRIPWVGKHVTLERINMAEKLFDRYGIWVVAVGRLFAGIRGAMVIAAGATRFSFVKFVIVDGLAALVSGGAFIWLGHWVGVHFGTLDQLQKVRKQLAGIEHWVVLGLVVLVLGLIAYIWMRKPKAEAPADRLLERAVDRVERRKEEHKKAS